MTARTRRLRHSTRWLRALLLMLPFFLLAVAYPGLRELPPLAALEANTLDWRYALRGTKQPSASVIVIAIDDRAVRTQGGWPIPRAALGRAVDILSDAGATAIAVDLLLAEPARDAGGDSSLARALERNGRILLPVAFTFDASDASGAVIPDFSGHAVSMLARPGGPKLPEATDALVPVSPLAGAASGLGHVNVLIGQDGALRQLLPGIAADGQVLPALPVAAVALAKGLTPDAIDIVWPDSLRLAGEQIAIGAEGRWTLAFYGPSRSFPTYSLAEVLEGGLPVDAVEGRIVWIGATATAVGDTFVTPFDPALSGVEVFATATANLLQDDFLVRNTWTALASMAAIVLIGLLTAYAARVEPVQLAIVASGLPLIVWFLGTAAAFSFWNIWLNVTVPALAGVAATGGFAVWRLLLTDAQRQRLANYLPRRLVAPLAAADAPEFEGRVQPAAILFVDLADFTAGSELRDPSETARFLRLLHATFEDCATTYDGYVDSFAGDGAMLVFGVPTAGSNDSDNALACAHALLERARAEGWGLRVGLHFGEVQVARLGGHRQRQMTLAGDAVNLASRLLEVAKGHGAALAVSSSLTDCLTPEKRARLLAGLSYVEDQAVRGRHRPVNLWLGWVAPPR